MVNYSNEEIDFPFFMCRSRLRLASPRVPPPPTPRVPLAGNAVQDAREDQGQVESIYAKIFAAKMKVFSFRKEEKKPAETLHDFLVVGFSIIFTFQKRITLFASSIFSASVARRAV